MCLPLQLLAFEAHHARGLNTPLLALLVAHALRAVIASFVEQGRQGLPLPAFPVWEVHAHACRLLCAIFGPHGHIYSSLVTSLVGYVLASFNATTVVGTAYMPANGECGQVVSGLHGDMSKQGERAVCAGWAAMPCRASSKQEAKQMVLLCMSATVITWQGLTARGGGRKGTERQQSGWRALLCRQLCKGAMREQCVNLAKGIKAGCQRNKKKLHSNPDAIVPVPFVYAPLPCCAGMTIASLALFSVPELAAAVERIIDASPGNMWTLHTQPVSAAINGPLVAEILSSQLPHWAKICALEVLYCGVAPQGAFIDLINQTNELSLDAKRVILPPPPYQTPPPNACCPASPPFSPTAPSPYAQYTPYTATEPAPAYLQKPSPPSSLTHQPPQSPPYSPAASPFAQLASIPFPQQAGAPHIPRKRKVAQDCRADVAAPQWQSARQQAVAYVRVG